MGRGLALVALLAAGAGAPLAAQSEAERASLDAFRDSLAAVTDSTALAGLERGTIDVARVQRDSAMLHLRLGLVALRLGELGRKNGADDAAGEFEWASELQPRWPWPWYGQGLAEYAILDSRISVVAGVQAMFGRDRLTRAAGMFAKSAEVDPTFVRGLTELTSTTLQQRINLRLQVALEALRRAATTEAGQDPRVLLARGRVEREVGDLDSSVAAFRSYLARGGDSTLGRLEVARSELGGGHLEGVPDYYYAAGAGDTAVDGMIRSDLVDLVGDSGLVGLDSLKGAARARWLEDFWGARDRQDLRASGERLAEHYRRIEYAHRNFRLVSERRQYRIEERFRSYNRDYDDRGLIYIRHGEPTDRATAVGQGLPLNQSWRYARPEGDLIFHFVAREDVQDYKLVESIYDILGFDAAVKLHGGVADTATKNQAYSLLQTRERFAPIYGRLIAGGGSGTASIMDKERMEGRASIALGTRTDSYLLQFEGPLNDVRWNSLAAGGAGDSSVVHLAWAVPERSLTGVPSARGLLYPVRVRYALIDLATGKVAASVDTTTTFFSAAGVPKGEWLVGRVPLAVPAGRYVGRVSVQEGGAGMLSAPDTVVVPSRAALDLSDLVLGSRRTNLSWLRTPEDTVLFNPVGTFRADVPLQLFYEVFGVPAGATYRTEIKVIRPRALGPISALFGGGGSAISLRHDDQAYATRMPVLTGLDISRL
ncbi:MAG TPA: GWxTD domain-containing protein, partial [Anaeromyxobacteraceae bacterium]|nr:GWxTD domain-containing protein [Anaeromyxobacteraceae bacterium]